MIHITVKYVVKRNKLNTVKKAIREFIGNVRKNESGTIFYQAFQENNIHFLHFMAFRNKKSKKIHETSAYVKEFVSILYPNCEKKPTFAELKLVK